MNTEYQQYLEDLFNWGKKLKTTIEKSDLSEHEKAHTLEQVDSWMDHIHHLLIDADAGPEQLIDIRAKGEQFLDQLRKSSVPYGKHQLPALPYAYNALEPYISERIMYLHHTKHHQAYVDGLNEAEKALYTNEKGKEPLKHWLREQAFHGSGHYLHSIFWENMTPNSKKKPSGQILKQIEKDFGSWNNFKQLFTRVAESVEGDGWAVLLWSPISQKLAIQSFEKHQLFQIPNTIPLLVLDVWEHAYYLQHENDKASYIENWWNVVNWENVNDRFKQVMK
ncbi:superoxide dismutase [Gracilibacillus sp. S3-1-1]|uniref:Superoxide dismutase n=1 Tax=Gracilibacillus pellucidus TaxID=3095368 RepID=A0ACC6M0Y2_9BACI|nr:superoxide dismutase [Gracilibacillus sp. S3-1-1]MDX8044551.1 superoxide dismutase [Gracilibacillus sp. S3-1-1]